MKLTIAHLTEFCLLCNCEKGTGTDYELILLYSAKTYVSFYPASKNFLTINKTAFCPVDCELT